MIKAEIIERIRKASNVVDVIGEFYQLKRDGAAYTCLCPFHQDRHIGSFKMSESRNIYTCFACGAQGDSISFLMKHEGLSFLDAIRWLGAKYGIPVDEEAEKWKDKVKQCKPYEPLPPLETLSIPRHFVKAQMQLQGNNTLTKWLKKLPWQEHQAEQIDKVLRYYAIGGTKDDFAVFPQIDHEGFIRSAKLMRYKADGHRDKEANPYIDKNGETRYHSIDWMHTRLAKMGLLDLEGKQYKPTLFGMHLLKLRPNARICIVESEKTALIATIAYGFNPNMIWMATGGMRFLKREILQPLIDDKRRIMLYPDRDGEKEWRVAMNAIGYRDIHIDYDFMNHNWRKEDGPKADVADVIVRILHENIHTMKSLSEQYPETFTQLVYNLDLIEDER